MVYAEHYYRVMRDYIEKNHLRDDISGKNIVIEVPKGEVSKVSGQKRANKLRLQNEYNVKNVRIIENPELFWYNIRMRAD